MEEKICGCCWLSKPIEEFYVTGDQCYCKVCNRKKVAEWQKNNPEKYKARQKNWYRTNTEKAKAAAAKWAKENPDKVREKARRWRQNNPLKAKIQDAKGNFKKKMKRQKLANELIST